MAMKRRPPSYFFALKLKPLLKTTHIPTAICSSVIVTLSWRKLSRFAAIPSWND